VPDTNKGLAERVEVFTRATSDALQKAVGEVLDARNPWQLLYRLSRIVLLGLVLYTAWLLITLQPDLAKRMSTTTAATLQEQVRARQGQVQTLLRTAIESGGDGLHTLALLQWEGGGSVTVLAADGRHGQLALTPGQQPVRQRRTQRAAAGGALRDHRQGQAAALPGGLQHHRANARIAAGPLRHRANRERWRAATPPAEAAAADFPATRPASGAALSATPNLASIRSSFGVGPGRAAD
jgi:hypothetical protein